MKTYILKSISIAFIISILFSACKKNSLDLISKDKRVTLNFWKSPQDAEQALTGCYNTLYADGEGQLLLQSPTWDTFTDNAYSVNNIAGSTTFLSGNLSPNTGGFSQAYYKKPYIGIALVNNFLANAPKVVSGSTLDNYKGQVFFLRAFYYFYLTQLYGDVPMILDDSYASNFDFRVKKGSTPQADILKQIHSDLDSAIALLPDASYTDGHVVKGTAQGYKLRVLMFEKKYSDAHEVAKNIITDGKFALENEYDNNFMKPNQNSSKEIMFSVKFLAPNLAHSPSALGGISLTVSAIHWQNYLGTQNLIDTYQCTDGKDTATSTVYLAGKPYENRDPRMRKSFFFPGDGRAQGWPYVNSNSPIADYNQFPWLKGFYSPRKWVDPKVIDPGYASIDDQDFVQMRYADVLLLNAEALNELGRTAEAKPFVDQVRNRVKMPSLADGLDQTAMRKAIRYERRVEFALEGIRFFDLKRWGIAQQTLNGFVRNPLTPNIKSVYPSYYDIWPIPQSEVDYNRPMLNDHNKGYN